MEEQNTARQALDAGVDAARLAAPIIDLGEGRKKAMVPNGYALQDVTDPHLLPEHITQRITVDDRLSLSTYVNRFRDERTVLIADYDNGKIAGHLDWHHGNDAAAKLTPDQDKHTVTLALRDSEEYKRWSKMEGDMHSQDDFALFIEENVSDVIDPEQGVLLEVCRDLEATQGVQFKSGTRLENGDRSFTYQTETQVKSEVSVPTEIGLSIPLYQGEPSTDIRAKFRFRPTANGLFLGFRWHRVEYQRQATFNQMAFKASEETGAPLYFGRTT